MWEMTAELQWLNITGIKVVEGKQKKINIS
jgi:hypothetical protein